MSNSSAPTVRTHRIWLGVVALVVVLAGVGSLWARHRAKLRAAAQTPRVAAVRPTASPTAHTGGGPRVSPGASAEGAAVARSTTLPPLLPLPAPSAQPPRRAGEREVSPLDQPMSVVWPAVNQWSDTMEREYGQFVTQLGRGVAAHRCRFLEDCLSDPSVNAVYDPATDAHIKLGVDCADLPYILRAYFAFKRRLPFGFVSTIRGQGPDPRYALQIRPVAWRTWRDYHTPRQLFSDMVSTVHSGMYRTAPGVQDSDFYSIAINRQAVHPGSVYYDPNGHVLVVAEVRPDGVVQFVDGHPGGGLTWKRFGQAFAIGTARLGGGFRDFRPITYANGRITRASDSALHDFDGRSQYTPATWVVDNQNVGYHAWVRAQLTQAGVVVDPVNDFREEVRAVCRDIADRAEAVDFALTNNLQRQGHPESLPDNIYGTMGDWELYSTPSRDARLKASFRELRETVSQLPTLGSLAPQLQQVWHEEAATPECHFTYTNSAGAPVTLDLDAVLDRLFAMSFDPYNCPELRWGAPDGSPERATCVDDPTKVNWYMHEQRLRNRIDREYGRPTPLDFGPEQAPDVDVRRVIGLRPVQG